MTKALSAVLLMLGLSSHTALGQQDPASEKCYLQKVWRGTFWEIEERKVAQTFLICDPLVTPDTLSVCNCAINLPPPRRRRRLLSMNDTEEVASPGRDLLQLPPDACPPGGVCRDPRVMAFGDGEFFFNGLPSSVFNIITASSMQLNCRFAASSGLGTHTKLSACGVQIGANQVEIDTGCSAVVNGVPLADGTNQLTGTYRVYREAALGWVFLQTSEWALTFCCVQPSPNTASRRLDILASYNPDDTSPEPQHGVLGQTTDMVMRGVGARYGNAGALQGEGNIDGVFTDYEVQEGTLFGNTFTFNNFAPGNPVLPIAVGDGIVPTP